MNTTVYRLYVGLTDKDGQDVDHGYAIDVVISALYEQDIHCATIHNVLGLWHGVKEPSLVVEIIDIDGGPRLSGAIRAMAVACKTKLNQHSVLVLVQSVGGQAAYAV